MRANPDASAHEIAELAGVGRATAQRAKKPVGSDYEEKPSPPKKAAHTLKPEVQILRKALVELRAPFPVFRKCAIAIHGLNVSGQLLREYLDACEPRGD